MKLLLIYPPKNHHVFGSTFHSNVIEVESGCYPPIGLMYIASYVMKNSNCEVKIIDSNAEKLSHDGVKGIIEREKPDIVGIYFTTFYLHDGIMVARAAKALSKDIIVIAGGPHISLYSKETISIPEIDIAVEGEGEAVTLSIIKAIQKNRLSPELKNIPGVILKENKNNFIPHCRVPMLNILPFPARELVDYKKYRSILAKRNPITTIISSRGCSYRCKFCSNLESGHRVRYRSAKNVVDEMQECIEKFGIYDFFFFDELFTVNKERVIDICNEIKSRNMKIRWHCRSRADVLDEEMIIRMKKAGCRLIQFGIETGSERLQKYINKNLNLIKVHHIIKNVYENGIHTYADFMVGLPTETREETMETIEYAKMLDLDYAAFRMFGPLYGSEFYDEGLKEGRFVDFWRDFVANPVIPVKDGSWSLQDTPKYHSVVVKAYRQFYYRPWFMIKKIFRTDSLAQMGWQLKSGFRLIAEIFKKFNN